MHAVADNVLSGKISAENKAGVSAVQDADLSLLVRSDFGYDVYVEAGLPERELFCKCFRSFDIPYAEDLADIEKRVLVAVFLIDFLNFLRITDSSGNDTVNQRGAEEVLVLNPVSEIFAKAPVLDVLQNALSEFLSVVVDQLAGEDCNTLLTCLETLVKKYGQLCGE